MTISPFDIILLLGSLQGFILATLLWVSRKGNRLSNRLLAALIGLMALMSLAVGIPQSDWQVSFALDMLPFIMVMPLGPLIFFYTKSVLDPSFQLGKTERQHFYPVLLDWGARLIAWVFVGGVFLGLFPREDAPVWGHFMDEYNTYVDIPRWISVMGYLLLTRQFLNRHNHTAYAGSTHNWQQNGQWLRQFVHVFLVFQGIWLVHLVPYIIPSTRSALLDKFGWYPIYVPIAILIYWLGLKGYLNVRHNPDDPRPRKTGSTNLPDETAEKAIGSLTDAMQTGKLFLDPELTVEKVARHVQLAPKMVSFVLNQHLQKSFNAFVNEYRVEAVKKQITNPANEHLTLTGIAFECGFNSQATFQRAFRQATGMSPKEFAGQQTEKS